MAGRAPDGIKSERASVRGSVFLFGSLDLLQSNVQVVMVFVQDWNGCCCLVYTEAGGSASEQFTGRASVW